MKQNDNMFVEQIIEFRDNKSNKKQNAAVCSFDPT